MKIADNASIDDNTHGGGEIPPCIRLAPDALPEVQQQTTTLKNLQSGVSTRNAHKRTEHWYALRTTYGRERKAHDFINAHNGKAFLPTIVIEKVVNGKKKLVEVSRFPNIFFAYGIEEDIKSFVYDNYNLPFLRFYYKHTHVGSRVDKSPMIVPDSQIKTLQIICDDDASDNVLVLYLQHFYRK